MPDPNRLTISASQAPALFNASRYLTRFMLYHEFVGDLPATSEDARMSWGKKLEPLILEQAADELKLVVTRNAGPDGKQEYVTNGIFGCHRDGEIMCPDRGPGAIETKAVFDYGVWMREWGGGKSPPREYETQLQTQMKVGRDGESYRWGVIAAWVGGEQYYFEREPVTDLWSALDVEGRKFLDDVAAKREPEPFGVATEAAILNQLFRTEPGTLIDLREDPDAIDIVERVRQLDWHSRERLSHERAERDLKAWLIAKMLSVETLLLPHGVSVKIKQQDRGGYTVKPTTFKVVSAYVPEGLDGGDIEPFRKADLGG